MKIELKILSIILNYNLQYGIRVVPIIPIVPKRYGKNIHYLHFDKIKVRRGCQ